jgi:hypothetical protein
MALYTWPGRKRLVIQDHADDSRPLTSPRRGLDALRDECSECRARVGKTPAES